MMITVVGDVGDHNGAVVGGVGDDNGAVVGGDDTCRSGRNGVVGSGSPGR